MENIFKGINAIDFGKKFRNNTDCLDYLVKHKWDNGYSCVSCKCKEFIKGRTSHYRRCKACYYDESALSNTLFHGVKMPILKAFHMLYRVVTKKKGMSSVELSTEVGVQQMTAWKFRLKIRDAMTQIEPKTLVGNVDVDETLVGGYSAGCPGRSLEEKTAVLIAIENLDEDKTGNIRMKVIKNFTADVLKDALDETVSKDAKIRADKYPSYKAINNRGGDIEQVLSNKGQSMVKLHNQILNFKLWLRGIHHKCTENYLQTYLDEHCYRFNRRNKRHLLFDNIVFRFMAAKPKTYNDLMVRCEHNT